MLSTFSKALNLPSKNLQSLRQVSAYLKDAQKLEYKPLPRSGNSILDFRRDRKIIEDGYKPKNADFKIRFELMDQNDIEFMTQYATEFFVKDSNVMRHLKITGEELIEIFQPVVAKWISSEMCTIIKHGDKIAGAVFGNSHEREEFDELYRGQLFHENPKLVIKDDYAEDIKNGPFKSPNVNRFYVLWDELEWQTGKFLPKDTQKLAIHELYIVDPNYMGNYLATKCGSLLCDMMIEKGCTHEVGYCVATGTWKMSKHIGHQTIYSLPYEKFLENGKPIFYDLYDGATAANVTFAQCKKKAFLKK